MQTGLEHYNSGINSEFTTTNLATSCIRLPNWN